MKILTVVDKTDSAIDRLARGNHKYMDRFDHEIVAVHPKRPDQDQLEKFASNLDADIIDWQYFRTAEMLREGFPLSKDKPSLLAHHNPYSVTESDWNQYDLVIANNSSIYQNLKGITQSRVELVPNAVDFEFFTFNQDYKWNDKIMMVANRIESKKGILPVAQACKKLGMKLMLVGNISDPTYFRELLDTRVVEFGQNVSDEELQKLYHQASLFVCNSVDNFESGPLPNLEAMASGVPVLSRPVGLVPDYGSNKNMFISNHAPDDIDAICQKIQEAQKSDLNSIRQGGWNSAKNYHIERRAYNYMKLFYELYSQKPLVSVIVPICGNPEITSQCLKAIEAQVYPNLEVIIANDGQETISIKDYKWPVKVINTPTEGYGLAQARNKAIIESLGDIIVFCDQRIIMDENAVDTFVDHLEEKTWLYGTKGVKKEFVENFSCVHRQDIIDMGMFNERIEWYGGMSQEVRTRARRQGMRIVYLDKAKATPVGKSRNRWTKHGQILKAKTMLWKVGLQ